jgi:hypothetical protein
MEQKPGTFFQLLADIHNNARLARMFLQLESWKVGRLKICTLTRKPGMTYGFISYASFKGWTLSFQTRPYRASSTTGLRSIFVHKSICCGVVLGLL